MRFVLPGHPSRPDPAGRPISSIWEGRAMHPELILVVDDDENSLIIFESILEMAGHHVRTARSGWEALELLRVLSPAALILDVHLPIMDGLEVIRTLRAEPRMAWLPVVALTADALPDTRMAAEGAGCDLFLLKPIEPAVLVLTIRELIERRRPAEGVSTASEPTFGGAVPVRQ